MRWWFPLVAALWAAAPGHADVHALAQGRRLFHAVEYEKAISVLGRAVQGKLSREEQIEAFLLLAKAHRALNHTDEAAGALRSLLHVDPEYRLSAAREPPSLIALLERVRLEMATAQPRAPARRDPPRIQHEPVKVGYAGLGVTLSADVSNLRREHRVRLYFRRIGQLRYERVELTHREGTHYRGTISGAALRREPADYLVEYYLAVTDGLGEAVARVGSEEQPLHLRVVSVQSGAPAQKGGELGEPAPWYRRHWWIWVAIGAVVVGGAVGAGIAAR